MRKVLLKALLFTLLFIPFLGVSPVFAQEQPQRELNLDLFVQELFSQQQGNELAYEDIYENLLQFYQNPINLNHTSREELSSLFILSETQISALLAHLDRTGKLLSIYELQSIEGFTLPVIYRLLPFVRVEDAGLRTGNQSLWERITTADNNYLLLRYQRTLQTKKGYLSPKTDANGQENSHYFGSPDKVLMRYRVAHARDFSMGFIAEKDAGEQFCLDPKTRRYGFDFHSAHFQLYDKGRLKTLALGDYQLQFGQGLVVASVFGVGKGGETINTIRRSDLGIRPFTSTMESSYFRGAAAAYSLTKNLTVTGFYSNKNMDVSLNLLPDSSEQDSFQGLGSSSLQQSGFHRTQTEISHKHTINEQIMGANTVFTSLNRNFSAGFTAFNSHYSLPLLRPAAAYNRFEFQGRNNLLLSGYYSYIWRNMNFFGEAARSESGGWGTVHGLMASVSDKVEVAFLYRNFARDFHSFYGTSFGENSRLVNESGMYMGLKIRPVYGWEFTAYYDRFRFPWLKYGINAPSGGSEYLLRLLYKPARNATLYAQFRSEKKGREDNGSLQPIPVLVQAFRHNYLFSADFAATPTMGLRTRVQGSSYEFAGMQTTGYLLAQDLYRTFGKFKISASYALFDTDDYENRQYFNEKDVLYAFSIPSFGGRGTRTYLLCQYSFSKSIDVWMKLGHTHYRYQQVIGSGLEEIAVPRRTDVQAQVRYKF